MTKRDVAIWFCKVVALVGMMSAALSVVRTLISWQYFGVPSLFWPVLPFGLYLFVWFLARGIGTEIAAEGEHGEPMVSGVELGSLTLRCVGFWLFLSGSISFGPSVLSWVYEHFFSSRSSPNPIANNILLGNISVGLLQSGFGFLLAFLPRIRAFFRAA